MLYSDKINEFIESLIPKSSWLGVHPRDKFPFKDFCDKKTQLALCIVNLDKADEPGSHFIAFARKGTLVFVYDSFGSKLHYLFLKPFTDQMKTKYRFSVWFNDKQHQSYNRNTCGYFVTWFILQFFWRNKDLSMKTITTLLTNQLKNTKTPLNERRVLNGILNYIHEFIVQTQHRLISLL